MSAYDQMREAVMQAQATMRAADNVADDMARILRGRLRKVSTWHLKRLKKELSQFNAHTGTWKEDQ